MTLALNLGLSLALVVCGVADGGSDKKPAEPKRTSILFIGNSLTYTHDLPQLVSTLLGEAGYEVEVEGILGPNLGLQDHWGSRRTQRRIRKGDWDYVVLQQGPSATEGRPSLLDYGERFSQLIVEAGAQPAFYMVWPSAGRSFDFLGVSESYRMVADQNNAILLPVGDAWRAVWRVDSTLRLYGPDGFHPSQLGSYLAAIVIYQGLTGEAAPERAPTAWAVEGPTWEQLVEGAEAVGSPALR